MGTLTFLMHFAVYGGLGMVAAGSRRFLMESPAVTLWIGRSAGVVFIAAAVLTLANGLSLV